MAARKPWIRNQKTAVLVGVTLTIAGSLAIWDAHERRGRQRPFALKFLPGA
jgi:hypothetical protein